MARDIEHYKAEILETAYADFYAADHTTMLDYPLRLGNAKPSSSSPTIAEKSTYILDSGIGDDSVGNAAVVERGEELPADIVVPSDKFGEPEVTTGRVLDLFYRIRDLEYDPEVIIPLQTSDSMTHPEHYDELRDLLAESGIDITGHRLAVGGIKEWDTAEQIAAVIDVREHVGTEADIHGFGLGMQWNWLVAIRKCPWLLDSFDNSNSVKNTNTGRIVNPEMETISYKIPRGTNSTSLYAMMREFMYYMVAFLIHPGADERDAPTEFTLDDPAELEAVREVIRGHQEWYRATGEAAGAAVADGGR